MKVREKERGSLKFREMVENTNRHTTNNQGSATVEMTMIMFIYMMIIIMLFQGFFLLLSHTEKYYANLESYRNCSIEKTVKALRRWQFIDGIKS